MILLRFYMLLIYGLERIFELFGSRVLFLEEINYNNYIL